MKNEFVNQQPLNKENFTHFVVSRFNIRNKLWRSDKQGKSILNKEWLRERLDLFTKYCLPSLKKQSCKNFTWLIYFDHSTPANVRRYVDQIISNSGVKTILMFVSSYEEFSATYCEDIRKMVSDPDRYIITTRLDNDDIVHEDFIKRIQASFEGQEFMAVNFTKILKVYPADKKRIYVDYLFSNHFISLIEKPGNNGIIGCYSRDDTSWNIPGKVLQILDQPYCIELISGNNLYNHFCGFPVLFKTDLAAFQLGNEPYKNSLFDSYLLKPWKMSWKKLSIYLILRLKVKL